MRFEKYGAVKHAFAVCTVLVLSALACMSLAACNRDGKKDAAAAARAEAVASFGESVFRAADDAWHADMTDGEILSLDDCGGYLLTAEWLSAAGDFLAASSLQTAQIRALADYIASDEGKAALRDPENNTEALFTAFYNAGFSAYDTENIVYEGLIFLADNTADIYRSAAARMRSLLTVASGTNAVSLQNSVRAAERAADSISAGDTAEASAAVRTAEKGLKALVGFAYGINVNFGENGLVGLISDFSSGALSDVSDGEIFAYLDSLIKSFGTLGEVMTAEETAVVADAFGAVYNAFRYVALPLGLDEVFGGLKYAPFATEQINRLCVAAEDAGSLVYETDASGRYTYRFVKKIKAFVELENGVYADDETKEYVKQVNSFVLYAELAVAAAENSGKEYLSGLLEDYRGENRADRLVALFYVDFYFANWLKRGDFGEQTEFYTDVATAITADGLLGALRTAYTAYSVSPTVENKNKLEGYIQPLDNYLGGGFIKKEKEYSDFWYDNAVETVNGKLLADMLSLRDEVLDDFACNVDLFWSVKLPLLREIASFGAVSDAESDEFGELIALVNNLIGAK